MRRTLTGPEEGNMDRKIRIQPFLRGDISKGVYTRLDRRPGTVEQYTDSFSQTVPGRIYKVVGVGHTGSDVFALVNYFTSERVRDQHAHFLTTIRHMGLQKAEQEMRALATDARMDPFTNFLFVQVGADKSRVAKAARLLDEPDKQGGGTRKLRRSKRRGVSRKTRRT